MLPAKQKLHIILPTVKIVSLPPPSVPFADIIVKIIITSSFLISEASDCDVWYDDGHTDPGYFPINKNGESYVAYCAFGVVESKLTCFSKLSN